MYLKLNFQIFILIVLFVLTKNVEIYSLTLLFILIHELAHIITSLCLGYKIKKVQIKVLGFCIMLKKCSKRHSNFDKLAIIASGPMINILIAVLFIFLPLQANLKEMIVYSNLLLAIINSLPIFPLDGGRILRELLSFKYDRIKVIEIVEKITYFTIVIITVISSVLILFYKNLAIFVGVIFLWWLVIGEYRKNKYRKIAYEIIKMH